MTPLEDVLAVAGVRGSLAAPIDAGARWGVQVEAVAEAAFHAVTQGVAYLTLPGHETVRMMPGDVALLPRGSAHAFASDPDEPLVPFNRLEYARSRPPGEVLQLGDQPAPTQVLCAFYAHDANSTVRLFELLPDVIVVPAAADDGAIAMTVRLLGAESTDPDLGSVRVIDHLIEVLLLQVLRWWLRDSAPTETSWLRGLTDPVVRDALTAMHDHPERPWSLPDLASVAHTSRATLSRRFATTVGASPGAYLAQWRMALAAQALRETSQRVAEIAQSVGYESEFAFSRAFSRAFGAAPTAYRRQQRELQ